MWSCLIIIIHFCPCSPCRQLLAAAFVIGSNHSCGSIIFSTCPHSPGRPCGLVGHGNRDEPGQFSPGEGPHQGTGSGERIKTAVSKVLSCTWQRCGVHVMRIALAHDGKSGRRVVPAFIATAFAQGEADQESIRGIEFPPNAGTARTRLGGRDGRRVDRSILHEMPHLMIGCITASQGLNLFEEKTLP